MASELKIPSVGESVTEVEINHWLKQEGDRVEQDEPLAELETDKATVEVNAPVAGRLTQILKKAGETASVGDVIGYIEPGEGADAGEAAEQEGASGTTTTSGHDVEPTPRTESAEQEGASSPTTQPAEREASAPPPVEVEPRVMPAARVTARDAGVEIGDVRGTGPGGRVLKEDVLRHVDEGAAASAADAPAAASGASASAAGDDRETETVRMSPMRRRIAQRLVEAQQTAALLTTFNEVDMSAIVALRSRYRDTFEKTHGVRLGFMSFFVKASIEALKAFPAVNADIRGEDIVYRNYYDIGIAVNTPKGLVVPVLRNAERMSFAQIERSINDFAQRASHNRLELAELEGGTFTISNGGVFGSLLSTPIVNPPQSGILGMHTIQERPVARDNQVVIRPMMYIALTYDHRIVDGKGAVQFLVHLKNYLEDPARGLLEV